MPRVVCILLGLRRGTCRRMLAAPHKMSSYTFSTWESRLFLSGEKVCHYRRKRPGASVLSCFAQDASERERGAHKCGFRIHIHSAWDFGVREAGVFGGGF